MIRFVDEHFVLETKSLTYAFYILKTKHLEHIYFGSKIPDQDLMSAHIKLTAKAGSMVDYLEEKGKDIPLDLMPLEYSSYGKGDFKLTPLILNMPNHSYVSDFVYDSHKIINGILASKDLPVGHVNNDEAQTLIVTLKDMKYDLYIDLVYSVFYDTNVISRRTILRNETDSQIQIRKLMSMMLDIYGTDYELLTLDGGWIKEGKANRVEISKGTYINASNTGSSSNKHNPGVILYQKGTHEDFGSCYGVNLVYSGNHYTAIDQSNHGILRLMQGINPEMFEFNLEKTQSFETPMSVMTYAKNGFNELSQNMHRFIEHHIIPKKFEHELRPVAINSWEGFFFDFNESRLLKLAKKARDLGVELFVLDDGWFSVRDDDTKGLGDYDVNRKKLRSGLVGLSKKVHQMGMKFGLWFEPEMVNIDSKLYRAHPEYVVAIEGREPSMGRHQLVLDLCRSEVRDYIVNEISQIIERTNLDYIKWDMNRHMSDFYSQKLHHQGAFFHQYILGLYDVLRRIFVKYDHVLLETCSSGGNRFDLGMLSFGPQIWTSDNTDPISRLSIQKGISYLYPPSTMSNHVSLSPHPQTLRKTLLDTRFNVAMFGVLGYELDFKMLTSFEIKEVKKQIEYYKKHRKVLQYGTFYRYNEVEHLRMNFEVLNEDIGFVGNYNILAEPSPNVELLKFKGLEENRNYAVETRPQKLTIDRFGHLIAHALPIKLNPNKFLFRLINKYKQLDQANECFESSGEMLLQGYKMKQQFMGTEYNEQTRLLGDFGSQIYKIRRL
ncbi:alpha-galactosidase [Mycoplasmatota bacterium]|nr:alpha-galactosidase [Mycoplasmatota bacterium]